MIGKADIVESVVGVLDEKKKGWEADAEDRKLRNYTETIEVDPIFHSKIIGYKVNKTHIGTILKDSLGFNPTWHYMNQMVILLTSEKMGLGVSFKIIPVCDE